MLKLKFAGAVRALLLPATLVFSQIAALAADPTGRILGRVTDPSQSAIPGVTVQATAIETNRTYLATSGEDGAYVFNLLPVGAYRVEATHSGFRKTAVENVSVTVSSNTRVNLEMTLGTVTESVQVSAQAASVETTAAPVTSTFERQYVASLPNLNRNVLSFAELAPGVQLGNQPAQMVNIGGTDAKVNGNRLAANVFYLDGSDNTGSFRNQSLQMPNPEAVQEVTVSTANTSAEFGKQPGGVFNVITRSGSNDLHGAAFYFFRDKIFNANDYNRNRSGAAKPEANLKQTGGTLGGPVIRDKTFFFTSYQLYDDFSPGFQNTVRFPTAANLRGDFSAFNLPIHDPDTGQPFPGNLIPAARLDPVAQRLSALLPNVDNFGDRYVWSYTNPVRNNELLLKGDHNFTPANTTAVSYLRTWGRSEYPSLDGNWNNAPRFGPQTNISRQDTLSVRHTWTASPTVVVQPRFSMAKHFADRGNANLGQNLADFGAIWPDSQAGARKYLPQLQVADGFRTGQGWLSLFEQYNYHAGGTVTWVKGAHNIKAGAEFQRDAVRQLNDQDYASFNFDGRATSLRNGIGRWGYGLADFVLGRASSFNANGILDYTLYNWTQFYFLEDQWRVTRRLTITPGLRYELYLPASEKDNRASAFVLGHRSNQYRNSPLHMAFLGDAGIPDGFFRQDRNNFAPRLGLAYDVTGDGKTALRGGFGVYYAYNSIQIKMWNAEQNPWQPSASGGETQSLRDPWGTSQIIRYDRPPTPFSGRVEDYRWPPRLADIVGFPADSFRTPYTLQWNVALQREVASGVTVEAGYVANRGRKLLQILPINFALWAEGASVSNIEMRRPINGYSHVGMISSRSNSWFDSLQLTSNFRKGGFLARTVYVYGDAEAIATEDPTGRSPQVSDPLNWDRDRASVNYLHNLKAFYVYDMPFWKGVRGWKGTLLGGWQTSGSFNARSGFPLNVTIGEDWNFDSIGGDRPVRAGAVSYTGGSPDAQMARFFNPSAFRLPDTRNTFGDSPRDAVWGPGAWGVDVSLLKNFRVRESMSAQLRWEVYNLLNHSNLNNPNTNMRSADFTRILGRSGNRQMQIGLRFAF